MEIIDFHGHPLIKATHKTTLELTKESNLTEKGDCIIGVRATKACSEIHPSLRRYLSREFQIVKISIVVQGLLFEVYAKGHPSISLSHDSDVVIRKSNFICERTLAILSDKAAIDMPRTMVSLLRERNMLGRMIIEAV